MKITIKGYKERQISDVAGSITFYEPDSDLLVCVEQDGKMCNKLFEKIETPKKSKIKEWLGL